MNVIFATRHTWGCERTQRVTSRANENGLRVVVGFLREIVTTSQEDIKAFEFAVKHSPFLVKCGLIRKT